MMIRLASTLLATLILSACSSSGGVVDNTDLTKHWNGMHVDQVSKLWGEPVSSAQDVHGTRYAWSYNGCAIKALARDGYVVEIKTLASERDACNIVFARSRPGS